MIEAPIAPDGVSFELYCDQAGVWLSHPDLGRVNLGALDPVCDKLCDFLEQEVLN